MGTFHPFLRLPAELRYRVWELTVEPQTVDVRVTYQSHPVSSPARYWLVSSTPVPAPLQTCREARNHGLYEKAFSEINMSNGEESRYVWVNFDIDVIDIGETPFECYRPAASSIQRLKFNRKNSDKGFYHFEARDLAMFTNLKEARVVCADGIRSWWGAGEEHYWPCGAENLYFIDPDDGTTMRSIELDEMCEKEQNAAWAEEDGELARSWAQYGYDYPSGEWL